MSARDLMIVSGWAMIVAAGLIAFLLGAFALVTLGGGMVAESDLGVMTDSIVESAWPAAIAALLLWLTGAALRRMGTRRPE